MVNTGPPAVPRWTLAIHAVQVLFAIVVLGLDAYGIRWIAYNALIFSLVNCIITLGICAYLIASQLFLKQLYNIFVALGAHGLMFIFWIVDLGLVANLAHIWGSITVDYYYYDPYYYYNYYKRDLSGLSKRAETTTISAYHGALAAGAVFAAAQFVLWILSGVFLLLALNKQRTEQVNAQSAPPQYAPNNNGAAVPMEKYNQTTTTVQPQPMPQQGYVQPVQQQQQGGYVQPPQAAYAPYPQDPIPRQDTVSPVSNVGYAPTNSNVSEIMTPQHTGPPMYPSNASELSTPQHTGPPAHLPELVGQK